MFPLHLLDEEDEKGRTPPPLLSITELTHTARDWVVVYHFFLGPLDGHFTMYLGQLDQMSKEEANALAMDPKSPHLARAQLALLQAVQLETLH